MKKYPYTRKRVGAAVIDYILIWSLTIFYTIYFGEVDPDGSHTVHGGQCLAIPALWFLYFVVAERFGGTLGHRIFRLKVVGMDGEQPGTWRIFKRRLCDLFDITFSCGILGTLLINNTQYNQRLGDLVGRTQVIGRDDRVN